MFTYRDIFANKQRFLFVTAHPDDSVISFGALIHQLCVDKKEVHVLLVTNGARGSRDNDIAEAELAKKRLAEEVACLKVLGVDETNLTCLGYADGEVESNMKLIGEISKHLRKFKIELVATHEPSLFYSPTYTKDGFFVQHRDHRKIGEAVIDAVYPFSRDRSFFTDHYVEGISPHEVFDILLTDEKDCNFEFEFTSEVETKRQALRAHQTQLDEKAVEDILNSSKFDGKYLERFHYLKLMW